MQKYCILTGVDLSQDGSTNGIKQMCLNCKSCTELIDKFVCDNADVLEIGKKKILETQLDGFEIDTLILKQMTLKDPTKKCVHYSPDIEAMTSFIKNWFLPSSDSEKENAPE